MRKALNFVSNFQINLNQNSLSPQTPPYINLIYVVMMMS